jgi:hypothetical protein
MSNRTKKHKREDLLPLVGSWIPDEIKRDLPKTQKRFDSFERQFDERFPRSSSDRNRAFGLAWLMEAPLTLLILGHNSAAIVELHAWLERFTLLELSKRLGKDEVARDIIWELIKRRTLSEVTDIVILLGLWDQSDKAFISRLKNIRDGVAHKNFELLSKHIGGGKSLGADEATKLINRMDCVPYFLTTMELIMKLVIRRRSQKKPAT